MSTEPLRSAERRHWLGAFAALSAVKARGQQRPAPISQATLSGDQSSTVERKGAAYVSLERFLRQVQSASVEVNLRQVRRDGENARQGRASLQFQRPDRFRWDSQSPNDQLVLADGESLWIHDRDLEQVTVRPLRSALEGLPTGLLMGSERLLSSFKFEELPEKDGLQWLKASAIERQGLTDHITIAFLQSMPRLMQITDLGGRGMRYEFSAWKVGSVAAAQFRFVMPKGIDLIRMAR